MYPTRDFRFLIDYNPSAAVRAVSREPLTEILCFWKKTGKPLDKYKYYNEGIYIAVANGRYPCFLLKFIENFPEFHAAVRDGLAKYWCNFRFSLLENESGPSLLIDSISGDDIQISDQTKISILRLIGIKYSIPLKINEKEYLLGIFPSRDAEMTAQKFHWLQGTTCTAKILFQD